MKNIRYFITSNSILKNFLTYALKSVKWANQLYNKRAHRKKCYICGNVFHSFSKYRGGTKNLSKFIKTLEIVGSDINNFSCFYCESHDRERHLCMYFDKLNIWSKMKNASILHFAPEKNLSKKIAASQPKTYIRADLFPKTKDVKKINITRIPFKSNSFDLVICNHVLEHIDDYLKALREISRVLKPQGRAILQTPYSSLINHNFEVTAISTKKLRKEFYGQEDHLRVFSKRHLLQDIRNANFQVKIIKNNRFYNKEDSLYYGINPNEDLILAIKPKERSYAH